MAAAATYVRAETMTMSDHLHIQITDGELRAVFVSETVRLVLENRDQGGITVHGADDGQLVHVCLYQGVAEPALLPAGMTVQLDDYDAGVFETYTGTAGAPVRTGCVWDEHRELAA